MPPAVALLNYLSCSILWRIFCQTGTFRGVFSTYHWYRRILPHTVIFCGFFYLLFAGKISEATMWGAGVPECTLSCSWGGAGTQLGRLDRRPGTLWGGGAQRPVWGGNEPKKTGARSARSRTRGQNPLVIYIDKYFIAGMVWRHRLPGGLEPDHGWSRKIQRRGQLLTASR